jgi:hypothetical protein
VNVLISMAIQEQSGLTWGRILSDIPHDGPAFVVYGLLLVSAYFIWKGARTNK